jgi:hypothetical protein
LKWIERGNGNWEELDLIFASPRIAAVTVTYDRPIPGTFDQTCVARVSAKIRAIIGVLPTVRFDNGLSGDNCAYYAGSDGCDQFVWWAGVRLTAVGGCNKTRVVPASITLTGGSADFSATTKDACADNWVQRGRAPGVSTKTVLSQSGDVFGFNFTHRDVDASYNLVVTVNDHVVKRGTLVVTYTRYPPHRIWQHPAASDWGHQQGTSDWKTLCVMRHKHTYTLHSRRYCWWQYTKQDLYINTA